MKQKGIVKLKSTLTVGIIIALCLLSLGAAKLGLWLDDGRLVEVLLSPMSLYIVIFALGAIGCALYALTLYKNKMLKQSSLDLQAANALLESRLAAMELTLDGIFIVNKDGHLKYMNQALMDLHDIKTNCVSNYVNRDWLEIYPRNIQSDIKSKAVEHLHDHPSWTNEVNLGGKHNKTIELTLTKLPDGGLIGTSHDVTDKKQADEEREKLRSQFYQAQKMEAIGRMAGGVAHDFNNILAAINGYGEFLVEDLEDQPTEQAFAHKILAATQQAKKLVDQILTFSRRNDTKSEPTDIVAVLEENMSMIRVGADLGIDIQMDVDFERLIINANSSQLSQVIMNLCVNAIDAMEDTRGTLILSLKNTDAKLFYDRNLWADDLLDPLNSPIVQITDISPTRTILTSGCVSIKHKYVCLSITDTGAGMSRAIMELAFEPFFTTKGVDKGTGLGLSTVHGVITQHQGAIVIDSTVGAGTKFELYFPIAEGNQQEEIIEIVALSKFEFEGLRILFVEDQKTVREMTSRMLMRMGFDVIEADTGRAGLELIRKHQKDRPFHLVITDHAMPKMTGLEMILEASREYPDLPFVLLSGYSEARLQEIMKEHSCIKAVLRKPIEKEILRAKLYVILSQEDLSINVDPIAKAN